ncbi:hypothetical protein LY76DRAFT_611550 [Colletotrichum caudatum]|nr:hypothetical protein LY76DRAFT_611550 [Colletotrichum caudatum]
MATRNNYLSYKRDTRCLLYWVIHASNFVIMTNRKTDHCWKSPVSFNTSGTVTVDEFAAMTRLIGEEMSSVPFMVLGLLRSVILARTAHWDGFQQYTEGDPQVEKSFASDRIFTIVLYKAFEVFEALCADRQGASQESGNESQVPDAIEEMILASDFSFRDIRTSNDTESENESSDDVFTTQKCVKKRSKTGKKGKKKNKKNNAKTAVRGAPGDVTLAKVPLNDYRFLRTDGEQMTEYAMAICSYFRECYNLRAYLQGIWREVAYDGLNIVVAGALVQLAIGMIKKTESVVFADFPGRISFETLEKTITLGNVQKAEDEFGAVMHLLISDDQSHGSDNASIDLREYIMSYTYRDLVDFVVDYQQKPTREKRIIWRRAYTIKWLYDLVNAYTYPTGKGADGEHQDLENINWSPGSHYVRIKAVTGLEDFAAIIASLAMKKPGTYVPERILPHQVFVVQCVVDAFTVSRGWSVNMLKGDVFMNPSQSFNPTREIELFLDREDERHNTGCTSAIQLLNEALETDEAIREQPGYHIVWLTSMEALQRILTCLGRSTHLHEEFTFPESAFPETHANGLWDLSPFLCAVGLMDSVDLAFRYSMGILDSLNMISAMFHLHNMLVKAGYLTTPNRLYHSVQDLFTDCIFNKGKVPTYNFGRCLQRQVNDVWGPGKQYRKGARCIEAFKNGVGFHAAMNTSLNLSFKKKSNLLLYRDANWDIESIPDGDIEPRSSLAMLRISQTKQIIDSQTGRKTLEETDLIRRAKAELKVDNDELLSMASAQTGVKSAGQGGPRLTGEQLLRLVKKDIYNDVCGDSPSSGINYLAVAATVLSHCARMESELDRLKLPLFMQYFSSADPEKRLSFVHQAMDRRDEGCLQAMAGVMETFRDSLKDFVYWEDMGRAADMPDRRSGDRPTDEQCPVM